MSSPISPVTRSTPTEATAAIRLPGDRRARNAALKRSPPTLPTETNDSRKQIDDSRNASSNDSSMPWARTNNHQR